MYPLIVKKLTKQYGNFTAVDGISFELKEGEILGFLGPNGSGKTTTIQMLLGTLTPTSGEITYFGMPFPKKRSEALQHVSFASTYTSLPYILTVRENLRCFGLYYGLNDVDKRVDPLLERFGILDKKNQSIADLSAGQITRLMLVKAFFTNPKIVLLDEPTASLDPDMSSEVCKFLLEEREKRQLSILFTSHKMEEVAEICDRAIFLKQGNIIANDTPKKLAESSSLFQVRFTIIDGMKRAVALAAKDNLSFKVEHKVITLSMEESKIPQLLNAFMGQGIHYAAIRIIEPTLDDYFKTL